MSRVGLGRSGRRGRDELPLAAEVNLTSLVDVAFTLLVIFIITAPILQGGLDVNLPQADVRPVTAMDDLFIVAVRPDGRVYIEETPLTVEEFEQSFAQLAAAAGTQQLYIRANSTAAHGIVFKVAVAASNAGVAVSHIGEPRPVTRR